MDNYIKLIFVFAILLIVYSCSNKKEVENANQPKKTVFKNVTTKQAASFVSISTKIASLPRYDFYKIKDPFVSPIAAKPAKHPNVPVKPAKPTERYELEKYRLLGIVVEKKVRTAIFEDPDGKGWVVKEGMTLGNEGFRAKKITPNGVLFEEVGKDATGKKKGSEIFISIKKN